MQYNECSSRKNETQLFETAVTEAQREYS